jgi:sugar phosphate permease
MKCLIVTSRHGLLNWYPTFLLYAFSLSVLDLQFGIQLYFYNAVFHVVECGLEADQVSNFITRIQVNRIELQLFVAFASNTLVPGATL